MAQLPTAFNSNEHDDMNDFSCIPDDKYVMSIVKSELVRTKKSKERDDNKNMMLKMQAKVLQGKYKGKIIFIQLNIVNENPTAVEIAQKELATICRACGVPTVQDSSELHGIPMLCDVGIDDSNPEYPDKNVIRMYSKYDGEDIQSSVQSSDNDDAKPSEKKKRPWD